MRKDILICSIIAIIILILVSFTGVVGYQTTKSSTIAKASPLFSVRSTRAIDEESKDIVRDYVGKGEESVLSIPQRDDGTTLGQKVIDRIRKMDDKTFNRFMGLVINRLKQKGHTDIDNVEIVNTLNQLRTKQKVDNTPLINPNKPQWYTELFLCTFLYGWKPGCLPFAIAYAIEGAVYAILISIVWLYIIFVPTVCILGFCDTY